jgi:NAD(P)-dependent dehydrogenase (short-subunit alcohol dehydrogenase family)
MSRRIAILGGAGGIGRALVAALADAGDQVVVLDLPASIDRHRPSVKTIGIDVLSEQAINDATRDLAGYWPSIDGYVHLAGYNPRIQPAAETATDYFDNIVAGNLRGAFLSARAIMPLMQDGGSVVMIASGLGRYIRPGFVSYASAKAGLIAVANTLALEHAPRVRVNTVAPGFVDTAFSHGGTGISDETAEIEVDLGKYVAAIPLKRVASPGDIVGPIRFLLGPDSAYMTGQVLWVNGGAYMP